MNNNIMMYVPEAMKMNMNMIHTVWYHYQWIIADGWTQKISNLSRKIKIKTTNRQLVDE
jgi:hypothetical protein